MDDSDLIDVDLIDFPNSQTWSFDDEYHASESAEDMDVVEWSLACAGPNEDEELRQLQQRLFQLLDTMMDKDPEPLSERTADKHKFNSRTYVKPRRRGGRAPLHAHAHALAAADRTALRTHSLLSTPVPPTPAPTLAAPASPPPALDKYLTYNKYSTPPLLSPALRLHSPAHSTDHSPAHNPAHNQQPPNDRYLHTNETELWSECESEREGGTERRRQSKPINIDLSQPAHNLHNTFNKGRVAGAGRVYSGGDSLLSTSPPSLVSSLLLDSTHAAHTPVPGAPAPVSVGAHSTPTSTGAAHTPLSTTYTASKLATCYGGGVGVGVGGGGEQEMSMASSMTLSILDEKDMNTSFLSHTTCPDNDSLIGSLPPSLVSSVNSSYIVSGAGGRRSDTEHCLVSSDTYTTLALAEGEGEGQGQGQGDKLLSARPRTSLYRNMLRLDHSKSPLKQHSQHSQHSPKTPSSTNSSGNIMSETINIYSNKTFASTEDLEKENLDVTFKKDSVPVTGKTSLNVTLDKQELNEIIQARQKLSMARRNLPEPDASPPGRTVNVTVVDRASPSRAGRVNGGGEQERSPSRSQGGGRTCPSNETITLGLEGGALRWRAGGEREGLRRDATFKRSPAPAAGGARMDGTVLLVRQGTIDIDTATSHLLDPANRTLQPEPCAADSECAMTGSGESSDTATLSSGSPPAPLAPLMTAPPASAGLHPAERNAIAQHIRLYQTASTPRPGEARPAAPAPASSLVHNNLSPIAASASPPRRLPPAPSPTKLPHATGGGLGAGAGAGSGVVRRGGGGLPVSKLRQYSSHRDLSRLPAGGGGGGGGVAMSRPLSAVLAGAGVGAGARGAGAGMLRRGLYGSNPVLSPTHAAPPAPPAPLAHAAHPLTQRLPAERRDSYTIANATTLTEYNGGSDWTGGASKKVEGAAAAAAAARPALVRQGTETIRRPSTLHPPTDFRGGAGASPQSSAPRAPPARYAQGGAAARSSSAQGHTHAHAPVQSNGYAHPARIRSHAPAPRPVPAAGVYKEAGGSVRSSSTSTGSGSAGADSRVPRPSRLPAPRRALRPPSVYSVAPSTEHGDHY